MLAEDISSPRAGQGFSRTRLASDLRDLGLRQGQDLLVHCSFRRIGLVDGGTATLLASLRDVAGPEATLVVPAQTPSNSLSSRAFLAATGDLAPAERARFIAAMGGFDPATTPSTGMGAFAEHLRVQRTAMRSSHPQTSFAALGPAARDCTCVHDLECHLGERSPLGWLYARNAAILLLGVGYSACTAFHLAEYRLPGEHPLRRYRCYIAGEGGRVAVEFTDIELDDSDFAWLGAELDSTSLVRRGRVGAAEVRLLPLRDAVNFALRWFTVHRGTVTG